MGQGDLHGSDGVVGIWANLILNPYHTESHFQLCKLVKIASLLVVDIRRGVRENAGASFTTGQCCPNTL